MGQVSQFVPAFLSLLDPTAHSEALSGLIWILSRVPPVQSLIDVLAGLPPSFDRFVRVVHAAWRTRCVVCLAVLVAVFLRSFIDIACLRGCMCDVRWAQSECVQHDAGYHSIGCSQAPERPVIARVGVW